MEAIRTKKWFGVVVHVGARICELPLPVKCGRSTV
jgi:hypothetical protein